MARCSRNKNNIAIVGAGPSGIYCALNILSEFKKLNYSDYFLTIFDRGQILRTILVTGGGRCNLTNSALDIEEFISNYPRGKHALYSIFSKHFNIDSLEFFKSIGIETYTQKDGRIFPKSNSAKDVRDKMLNYLKTFKNFKIINKNINSKNDVIDFDKVIIAAGSNNTETLIKSFNHTCIEFKKSLCGLNIENNIYPEGVSVKSLDGDFVFTKTGISGPLAFKISSVRSRDKFPYKIEINLFNPDDLINEIQNNSKKSIGNILSSFVPKALAKVIAIDFDKKAAEISKKKLQSYAKLVLTVVSTSDKGEIVKSGGVCLDELDRNLKSKKCADLWFCGEILDIDGFCGGFNLQNCWSSAYVVAKDVVKSTVN